MAKIHSYALAWACGTIADYKVTSTNRSDLLSSGLKILNKLNTWAPTDATLEYIAEFNIHLSTEHIKRLKAVLSAADFDKFVNKWLIALEVAGVASGKRPTFIYNRFDFFNYCIVNNDMNWLRRLIPYLHDIPFGLIWNLPQYQAVSINNLLFSPAYEEFREMAMHCRSVDIRAIARHGITNPTLSSDIGWRGLNYQQKAILMMMSYHEINEYLSNVLFSYDEVIDILQYTTRNKYVTVSSADSHALAYYYNNQDSMNGLRIVAAHHTVENAIELSLFFAFQLPGRRVWNNNANLDIDPFLVRRVTEDKFSHLLICKERELFHIIFAYLDGCYVLSPDANYRQMRFFAFIFMLQNYRFIINRIVWAVYGLRRELDYIQPHQYATQVKRIMQNNHATIKQIEDIVTASNDPGLG